MYIYLKLEEIEKKKTKKKNNINRKLGKIIVPK